jgi:hypothetical protein
VAMRVISFNLGLLLWLLNLVVTDRAAAVMPFVEAKCRQTTGVRLGVLVRLRVGMIWMCRRVGMRSRWK